MIKRSGIALVMTIVVLLLIELMAAGMLALATQSRLAADARLRTARAETAAQGTVQIVLAEWATAGFDSLPIGSNARPDFAAGTAGDASWSASVERLGAAQWLVRSRARVGAGRAFSAGSGIAIARTLDTARARIEQPTDSVAIGGLGWEQVSGIADRIVTGSVVFSDSAADVPLTYAPAGLVLAGGRVRGILVVRGTLTLGPDASFEGLAVAAGEVVMETGSRIRGQVRSASGVTPDGAGITVSDSLVRVMLEAAPARLRVVPEKRRFIPVF